MRSLIMSGFLLFSCFHTFLDLPGVEVRTLTGGVCNNTCTLGVETSHFAPRLDFVGFCGTCVVFAYALYIYFSSV